MKCHQRQQVIVNLRQGEGSCHKRINQPDINPQPSGIIRARDAQIFQTPADQRPQTPGAFTAAGGRRLRERKAVIIVRLNHERHGGVSLITNLYINCFLIFIQLYLTFLTSSLPTNTIHKIFSAQSNRRPAVYQTSIPINCEICKKWTLAGNFML
jgi:hypothetical protein